MTLKKALDKLEDLKRYSYLPETQEACDALQLGIEAFKRFIRYRRDTINSILDPLPGETEE